MARVFYGSIDLTTNELLNFRVQLLPADPSPLEAKLYYNSVSKELRYYNGTAWVTLGTAGAGGPPSGTAGGDLTGSYPAPQIAAGVIVDADVNVSAAIAQSKILNLTTDLAAKALGTTDHIAGAGLTGGGTLAANRTFAVGAGTGITVNADDVAVNTVYLDGRYVPFAGGTLTGFLLTHADPTADMHVANKRYVDLAAQGFDFKNSVRAATTGSIALSGTLTIDGYPTVVGDRILVKDNTGAQNGIYLVASGAWSRSPDADASGEISEGALVPVEAGTTNADSLWLCTGAGVPPWVPGTSTSVWTRFSSISELIAGNGLTKLGNTLDVGVTGPELTVSADSIAVASAPKWTTPRSITLTGDVTGSAASVDGAANVSIATTLVTSGVKRYAAALPAATASISVGHNLNTRDLIVQVYNTATPFEQIDVEVEFTSLNALTVKVNPVLPAGYRVVIIG